MSAAARPVALATVLVGALGFLLLAAWLVPWQPVPGGAPAPVAPEDLFSAAQLARAEEYSGTSRLLSWSGLAVSLAVAAWLGFTRRGARLLGDRRPPWPVHVVVLTALVLLIGRLATLPFGLALHRHRTAYGLSTQGVGDYLLDHARGLGVDLVVTSLALLVLVGCARRWRRVWPAVAAGLAAALVVLGSFVYPLLVEPVFHDFRPLPAGELRTQILALADREDVDVEEVLVADASRRTTSLNAYVSGFGSTRRVVVWDTLLESEPDERVLAVVAHELAHTRHRDVLVGTALGALGAGTGVGLLALLLGSRRLARWSEITGVADPRAVALVLVLMSLGSLAAAPVENAISRRIETRADVDALEATGDPVALEEMQVELCLRAICDPTPPGWSHVWFGSHPLVTARVAVTRQAGQGDD